MLSILLPALAAAQITPISQYRTVYCLAEAYNNDTGDGGGQEFFEEANDFEFFDPSFSAEWIDDVSFAVAAAEVSQRSSILPASLEMQGDTVATAQTVDADWYAFATSSSDFELEFEVGEEFQYELSGPTITEGAGYLNIELRDGDGTLLIGIYQFETEFSMVEETGTLPAGTYLITISAFVDADGGEIGIPAGGVSVFDLELAVNTDAIGVDDVFTADRYLRVGPNPLQGSTQIAYASDRFAPVTLEVLDVRGRRIRELARSEASTGRVTWDGRDDRGHPVPQGLYILRMKSGYDVLLSKVAVVR